MIGMRIILADGYFKVEADVLWRTATESIPILIIELEKLLASID